MVWSLMISYPMLIHLCLILRITLNPKDNRQMQFVTILKKFSILLNKSQTPVIKKQKKEALSAMSRACLTHFGENITESKILKNLNNIVTFRLP
jgi:hypothetical protein